MFRHLVITLPRSLPKARKWVRETVREHDRNAKPINRARYPKAVLYFPPAWLQRVRLVELYVPPHPPLDEWDLPAQAAGAAERLRQPAAIALQDMVFLRLDDADDESLLVHELVHVVQWETLGLNRFLALYGLELLERGYEANALESMARDLQARFDSDGKPFDLMTITRRQTQELLARTRRRSPMHRLSFFLLGGG